MISDKETNAVYFSEILRTDPRYLNTSDQITGILDQYDIRYDFLSNTKDIWVRDFMPVQVFKDKFIEYRYDPDYLQAKKYRKIKSYPDLVCDSLNLKTIKTDIILDGGNVIKSKNSAILTDKVFLENHDTYNKDALLDKLRELFEVSQVVIIPWDKEHEFYGHSDGMLRFISDNKVLIQGYYENYPSNFQNNLYESLSRAGIDWTPMKFDVSEEDERNWIYMNFLQTKEVIIIPELGIPEDSQALKTVEKAFPEYSIRKRIFQVDVTELLKEGGGFNCSTWTILI